MKKNVSPGVIIAVIAALVVVIGFIAYRSLFKDPNASPLTKENMADFEAAQKRSAIHNVMGQAGEATPPGQTPPVKQPQMRGGGMYRHQGH